MKSILIVTEQFTVGGLETHIRGEVSQLIKKGIQVHLATGKNFNAELLPSGLSSLNHNIPLDPTATADELLIAINRLRQIIHEQLIDCIHVHPFTSIIPAVAAAELEAIPVAITLHGPASLVSYGPFYDFLLKNIILPNSELIITVSPEMKRLASAYTDERFLNYIPNAVSFTSPKELNIGSDEMNPHWVIVSRLDQFKIHGITDFCAKAKVVGIPSVLVVGDGPAKEEFRQELEQRGLSNYVNLYGSSNQVQLLMKQSAGVAGMGRVILEGIACQKPVVLVGYDGVKGVVDKALLELSADSNFSGRGLPVINAEDFLEQLKKNSDLDFSQLYDFAKNLLNEATVWSEFYDSMKAARPVKPTSISGLYLSLSGNPISGLIPYLHSIELLDRLGTVICGKKYYEPRLSAAVLFCRQRIESANFNQMLAERDTQITALNQAVIERDAQIASLNCIIEDKNSQIHHLNDEVGLHYNQLTGLLKSRSWKITRPMRVIARAIKSRGLNDSDRSRLYNFARRAYHRIPVSYETKLILRKYFLKLTGWTPATSNAVGSINMMVAREALLGVGQMPGLGLELQMQNIDNRIPYFGVRRPEGCRRVAILTNQLLDWNDGRSRFGGGERYALELARLLKELSFDVTFYQPSFNAPGEAEYYGFKVILLRTSESTGEFQHGICSEFTRLTQDFDHVYYHLPEYASGKVREDGLMTCHGIWFDHNNYPGSIFRTMEWFQQLYSAFSSPRCVISVDTNSIGVIRSFWPELASNMRFIPNFYDATSYFPYPESRSQERLTILFPRRSQINRGSRIFGEIVSLIPHDVEIIWLGEGDPVDTQIIKDVCKKDKRVSFSTTDFEQMPRWYQKADIAVIPTIACEGTSLSCIEALAVGCAVVSTNVGGLPDLIYDGMNGLLVDPEARSIAAAVNRLIVDRELRERLQRSAVETAHHFELRSWRQRWVDVLYEYGWVTDRAMDIWNGLQGNRVLRYEPRRTDKWLILTRNAIHGGVESLIREEAKGLNASVVVCGGHDRKDTCPFEYARADDSKTLERVIAQYDVILYHWLPDWCLDVLRHSGKRCIEFVHRTDTAGSDKTVPTALVTHSAFLAHYIHEISDRTCRVVDHPIAIDRFKPQLSKGRFIGAITSYYDTKGIDIFLQAWAQMKSRFPDYGVRFYGAGDDLPKFRKLASELRLEVDFREATSEPWEAMKDFACFVVPSRIEGLPVAILEALAMNIPVVASDLPGMVEFNQLSEARGYSSFVHLARKEDPQDFAIVMSQILEHGVEHDSSTYINDYYSPEKHCTDLVSIYRELCH